MLPSLNEAAAVLCDWLIPDAPRLNLAMDHAPCGAKRIDCGVAARGGLEAGRRLAEICLSGLAQVQLVPGNPRLWQGPAVTIATDQPLAACLASQYAGWAIDQGQYFAMGSGPMRAAACVEPLFETIGHQEQPTVAVGVLETSKLPPDEVCLWIAEQCQVPPKELILLAARTRSQAGCVQIVARSLETALHKLHEIGFDPARVESGYGVAPLPPVAANDLAGIGRTNDAILYGADVTLYVRGSDDELQELGPKIPSCSSSEHGRPFAEIFASYDHDFYAIDPLLFSPAEVCLVNLDSGRAFRFGKKLPDVIQASFGTV